MMKSPHEGQVRLADGRSLGYRVTGSPGGKPVLYFHGFPGSRMEAGWLCDGTEECEWRVFAIDRPGMGLSDFMPDRRLQDWPRDVAEFADRAGLEQFTLLGVSGGAPYAASCAWAMPDRVRGMGLVCGLGPIHEPRNLAGMRAFTRGLFSLLSHFPKLAKAAYGPFAFCYKHWPLALLDLHRESLPPRDRAVLALPQFREILENSFREAVRGGGRGGEHELKIYFAPWEFDPADIRTPTVLWHGERDTVVPCAMGRRLAEAIPGCRSVFSPEDGHYSLLVHWKDEILQALREM